MTGVSTCEKYVANQGEAFNDAYWTINSLKIVRPCALPLLDLISFLAPSTNPIESLQGV